MDVKGGGAGVAARQMHVVEVEGVLEGGRRQASETRRGRWDRWGAMEGIGHDKECHTMAGRAPLVDCVELKHWDTTNHLH